MNRVFIRRHKEWMPCADPNGTLSIAKKRDMSIFSQEGVADGRSLKRRSMMG